MALYGQRRKIIGVIHVFGKILYNGKHCIGRFPIVNIGQSIKRKTQWIIRKIVLQIYMRKINYTPVLKFKGIYRKIVFIFRGFCLCL